MFVPNIFRELSGFFQQLKNSKISILHDFRAVPAFCDVFTWSERPLDFAGNLNRAIFVRSGWFLHRWKALFKVDWECHTFRHLQRTFQHRKSSLKFKFSLVNVTIDPFLEKKWKFCLSISNFWVWKKFSSCLWFKLPSLTTSKPNRTLNFLENSMAAQKSPVQFEIQIFPL